MSLVSKKIKDRETLEKVISEIETKLDKIGYTTEEKYYIRLATDELTTNAMEYTTEPNSVSINYTIKKTEVKLKIKNKAEPFDWQQYTAPDYLKKINSDVQVPGRGLALVNKTMDELKYEFKKGYVIACARHKRK